ncbi:MAG: hypothetical protein ACO2PN_24050 [Pyrobaculum sp.]|jgi:hypothetical protein
MPNKNIQVAAAEAAGAQAPRPATEAGARGRIVMLNAFPLNALPRRRTQVDILPVDIVELGRWLHRRLAEGYELIHFVRHEATLQALRRELGIPLPEPNAGLYTYRDGDIMIVVTLKAPQRGQEQTQVRVEDLEFWIVSVV